MKKEFDIYRMLFYVVLALLAINVFVFVSEKIAYDNLAKDYNYLVDTYNNLTGEYSSQIENYNFLAKDYNILVREGVFPPYMVIHNRTIYATFRRVNGSLISWEIPFDNLERDIQQGYLKREVQNSTTKIILTMADGKKIQVMDFVDFVEPSTFKGVMAELYQDSKTDKDFISEAWNIIAQLTTYSNEIGENPRYPLETFNSGGGDCEDTSILFASMIKAAPVNWDVEFVYMDINNPMSPKTINHVIVMVDTGKERFLIETTSKGEMQPYENVEGWYVKI